jgi:hypothetical protein
LRYPSLMYWLAAISLALFFFLTNIHISYHRLLWYDEIGTANILKLPTLAAIWQFQQTFRQDSAPTGYLFMARPVALITGRPDLAARLLSAFAMSAALLVVFDCAKRLTDGRGGFIAACILASSFLSHYGYEGRPYALIVLFTSIALWIWLHTKDSNAAAAAFGVAIFLDVSMHLNSVLALVPFGVWELLQWRPWKMPSRKLMAGILGMACALLISIQQIASMHAVGVTAAASWSAPSILALVRVFSEFFPWGSFLLAVFALLAFLVRPVAKPIEDAERLCWLFLLIPFAGLVVAELATKSFYNRYLIAVLPGVSIAIACLAWRYLPKPASLVFVTVLLGLTVGQQAIRAKRPEVLEPLSGYNQQANTREILAAEDGMLRDGKRFVITNFSLQEEAAYYSKRPAMYVTYGPDADGYFCRFAGNACWDLNQATSHASELAAFYPSSEFISAMKDAGFQATLKTLNPTLVYFSPR